MERLFLIPAQGAIFLHLTGVGVALGALWQLLACGRRRAPRFALVWDALFALTLGASLLLALLRWRETGLRLYALLGLLLGCALYSAGLGRLAAALGRALGKRKRGENPENPAGKAQGQGE